MNAERIRIIRRYIKENPDKTNKEIAIIISEKARSAELKNLSVGSLQNYIGQVKKLPEDVVSTDKDSIIDEIVTEFYVQISRDQIDNRKGLFAHLESLAKLTDAGDIYIAAFSDEESAKNFIEELFPFGVDAEIKKAQPKPKNSISSKPKKPLSLILVTSISNANLILDNFDTEGVDSVTRVIYGEYVNIFTGTDLVDTDKLIGGANCLIDGISMSIVVASKELQKGNLVKLVISDVEGYESGSHVDAKALSSDLQILKSIEDIEVVFEVRDSNNLFEFLEEYDLTPTLIEDEDDYIEDDEDEDEDDDYYEESYEDSYYDEDYDDED